MTETICPYTGLRPFTEDESIFFKGRDEHIEQATHQLGRNKFLILTGASGDGKSSLVYAGIIPNAKAGFLKSAYSNWALADFRPERSPLENLSRAMSRVLGISEDTVKAELSHGFSALVDLYEASPLCAEEGAAPEKRRQAANLIVLADQFEEFFTNPENFHEGAPSQEAALVSNLLLETASIALERNLPIYVIITMRSDFIGQCAAFRGLPEYIGFSQFFVPRLNRVQLKEVIEEPAVLSGNRISPRLTERLIHDMAEGNDQLPILQHALNQVWKMADEGRTELDLIHYAMVGGMRGKDLPAADAKRFDDWFNGLPDKVKECYDQPGLENVLNTHANKLYILASDYLKKAYSEQVQEEDSLAIVEATFKCLTKIDSSRAVRNRMTLAEITAILNRPHLDHRKVGTVLKIFREPGNTLLRPFVEDVPELQPDTVLDITHESLIRNWERLEEWAEEEYHNLTTYLDFRQQVRRWLEHNRSGGFLLYIGPLTFFENWFLKAKPNEAWLARYIQTAEGDPQARARKEIEDAREFLRRSARKHTVTRLVMRYGPRRIAAVAGLILVLVLSSFGIRNYLRTQNSAVLARINADIIDLVNRKKANKQFLAFSIAEQFDNGRLTPDRLKAGIEDPLRNQEIQAMNAVTLTTYSNMANRGVIERSLVIADSLLGSVDIEGGDAAYKASALLHANDFAATVLTIKSRMPGALTDTLSVRNAKRIGRWVLSILTKQPKGYDDMVAVNRGIKNALTFGGFSTAQIHQLASIISPFEATERSPWLLENYTKDKQQEVGWFNYSFFFNGLYQQLANVYGALGDVPRALQCVDTLLRYKQNYFQQRYQYTLENATNVAGYFYLYGHGDQVQPFVDAYLRKSGDKPEEFYDLLMGRSAIDDRTAQTSGIGFINYRPGSHNLEAATIQQLAFFAEQQRQAITAAKKSADETSYLLAMCEKNAGARIYRKLAEAGSDSAAAIAYPYFDRAMGYFNKVSDAYLGGNIPSLVSFSDNISRRGAFYFLDFSPLVEFGDPRNGNGGYSTDGFVAYVLDKNLLADWLKYPEGPGAVEDWIWVYTSNLEISSTFQARPTELLPRLARAVEGVPSQGRNLNLAYLTFIRDAGMRGDTAMVRRLANHLRPQDFRGMLSFSIPNRNFFYTSIFRVASGAFLEIVRAIGFDKAWTQIEGFRKPENQAMLSAVIAKELFESDPKSVMGARFLDSALVRIPRVSPTVQQTYRAQILEAMAYQLGDDGIAEGLQITKNVGDKVRIQNFVGRALSFRKKLYDAYARMPAETSDQNRAFYFYWMLSGFQAGGGDKPAPGFESYKFVMIPFGKPFFYSDENQ